MCTSITREVQDAQLQVGHVIIRSDKGCKSDVYNDFIFNFILKRIVVKVLKNHAQTKFKFDAALKYVKHMLFVLRQKKGDE